MRVAGAGPEGVRKVPEGRLQAQVPEGSGKFHEVAQGLGRLRKVPEGFGAGPGSGAGGKRRFWKVPGISARVRKV